MRRYDVVKVSSNNKLLAFDENFGLNFRKFSVTANAPLHFPEFPEKRKFSQFLTGNLRSICLSSGNFRLNDLLSGNSRISRFSRNFPTKFAPVSKFSEILVEWKPSKVV